MCRKILLVCFALLAVSVVVDNSDGATAEINKPHSSVKSFPYLYAEIGNPSASYPVQDHLAISDRWDFDPNNQGDYFDDRPDFLFTDTGTYRIVEFYVHWYDV
jgi:hypothetical protein